jgi:hypothetical protein
LPLFGLPASATVSVLLPVGATGMTSAVVLQQEDIE